MSSRTALDEQSSFPTPSNDPGLSTHSQQRTRLSVIFNPVTQVHHYPPAVQEDEGQPLCGLAYSRQEHKVHRPLQRLPLTRNLEGGSHEPVIETSYVLIES